MLKTKFIHPIRDSEDLDRLFSAWNADVMNNQWLCRHVFQNFLIQHFDEVCDEL